MCSSDLERRGQLAEAFRHFVEAFGCDALDRIAVVVVLDAALGAEQHEAPETLRIRNREIHRDKAAAGSASDVEFIKFQVVGQGEKIVRPVGRWTLRIGQGSPESATLVCDETIAGLRERRDLLFPNLSASGERVEKNDRHALATGIFVKDLCAGHFDEAFLHRWCGLSERERRDCGREG